MRHRLQYLPALQATKTDVAPALKEGAALQLSGHRRFGLRNLAMGAQVAGSLLLLLVTGFLVLGIMNGNSIQTNFDQKSMVFLFIDPVRDGYTPDKAQAFFERLPERLRDAPAVTSFALAAQPPYMPGDDDDFHLTVDDPRASSPVQKAVVKQTVGAGYFALLKEPMLAGREFVESDQRIDAEATIASGAPVVTLPLVLNQKAAHALFGRQRHRQAPSRRPARVRSRGRGTNMKDAGGMTQAIAYPPLTRHDFAQPPGGGITIIARGHSAEDALGGVRSVVASMDPI